VSHPVRLIAALAALAGACTEVEAELQSTLVFRIDPASCAAYCADEVRALFTYLGQPAAEDTWSCAESYETQPYPVGAVVGIEVETYATGVDTVLLYEAPAQDFVVPSTGPVEVTVDLQARFAPAILATSPDPVLPGETLVVTADDVFSGTGKLGTLSLDGAPLVVEASGWGALALSVVLPASAAGSTLDLGYCGLQAASYPIRVFANSLGSHATALGKPCTAQALSPDPATAKLLVAAACDDATGTVRGLTPGGCAVETLLELPQPVAGIASAAAGEAFVAALADGNLVAGSQATPLAVPEGGKAVSVAATGGTLYAAVAHLDGGYGLHAYAAPPVAAWSELHRDSFELREVVAASDVVAATGVNGGGLRLVARLGAADPTIYPASECEDPVAVALTRDGATVAVACRGGAAAASLWIRTFVQFEALVPSGLPLASPVALAFDPAGDLLYVLDAGDGPGGAALIAVRVADGVERTRWPVADPPALATLAALPGDASFVMGGPKSGEVSVLTPYDASPPCP
jgi:hypothetical protein